MRNLLYISLFLINFSDLKASDINYFDSKQEIQEQNEYDYETSNQTENNPGFPVPAPINDYLPILIIAAVGLGFFYRKEIKQTIKSN